MSVTVLKLNIERGTNLIPMDANGKSDPFVVYEMLNPAGQKTNIKNKTEVIDANLNPVWNHLITLSMEDIQNKYSGILMHVFDKDLVGSDDFMGEATLLFSAIPSIEALAIGRSKAIRLDLAARKGKKDKVSGFLILRVEYAEETSGFKTDLQASGKIPVGKQMRTEGYRPKHPLVIIPGIYSSALECWEGSSDLMGERVWVTIGGMGMKPAGLNKVTSVVGSALSKRFSKDKITKNDEETKVTGSSKNNWVRHMRMADDGFSDPPGIRVRPMEGIHAIDYLCYEFEPFGKKPSYVMAYVIQALQHLGYDTHNLIACPYDWRIPPCKVNERDMYCEQVKSKIEIAVKVTGHKAALLGHSMGCKMGHYFLHWAELNYGYEWIEQNVHEFIASGAPWLGAPKTLRTLISGDKMGLDYFLLDGDMLELARSLGGQCWLLPHLEGDTDVWEETYPFANMELGSNFKALKTEDALKMGGTEQSVQYWNDYYMSDPVFGKPESDGVPRMLKPPPVPILRTIYGVNLPTEVKYFYKGNPGNSVALLRLSSKGDKKGSTCPYIKVSGGIGSEIPVPGVRDSGDGTVPLASLRYSKKWAENTPPGRIIENIELQEAEHREILNNDEFLRQLLEWIAAPPSELAA